jgi:L-aminopeptidase/D-esterase-like protein
LDRLTDVAGLRVGHQQRIGAGWLTGVTAVLCPPGGCVAGVDVRGGGPGTRETDALDPRNLVPRIDAVVFSGGSAYGLAAADGVLRWLAEQGQGYPVRAEPREVVPIVPAAVLFDLGRGGDFAARPDAEMGYAAARAAAGSPAGAAVEQGVVGAGTGAVAGGLKGGVGTASTAVGDVTVGALAVVNSFGAVADPRTGELYAGYWFPPGELATDAPPCPAVEPSAGPDPETAAAALNTTLAVVATDARIDRAEAQKLAGVGHDGLARAIRPVHTLFDGDTVFALATGAVGGPDAANRPAWLTGLHAAAADALTRAVGRAVLTARCTETARGLVPCYHHRPH